MIIVGGLGREAVAVFRAFHPILNPLSSGSWPVLQRPRRAVHPPGHGNAIKNIVSGRPHLVPTVRAPRPESIWQRTKGHYVSCFLPFRLPEPFSIFRFPKECTACEKKKNVLARCGGVALLADTERLQQQGPAAQADKKDIIIGFQSATYQRLTRCRRPVNDGILAYVDGVKLPTRRRASRATRSRPSRGIPVQGTVDPREVRKVNAALGSHTRLGQGRHRGTAIPPKQPQTRSQIDVGNRTLKS